MATVGYTVGILRVVALKVTGKAPSFQPNAADRHRFSAAIDDGHGLTATQTSYPGTDLKIKYSVKGHDTA